MHYSPLVTVVGAHDKHPTYPLFPGDILFKQSDGYAKHNGLGVLGFQLTDDQVVEVGETIEDSWDWLTYCERSAILSRGIDTDPVAMRELFDEWKSARD
jgi:hypothetical protein